LIGVCVLAGMGGSTLTDLAISLLSGAGIKVTIVHDRDPSGDITDEHNRS
jgi:predicted ATP-dependent endonuclease of OLD family